MADYISREVAIEAAFDYRVDVIESDYDRGYQKAVRDIAKELNSIPTADERPVVSAEWERPKGSTPRSWIFVCSKCGDRAYFPVPKYFPKGCGYNYCPNCGADMMEREENAV